MNSLEDLLVFPNYTNLEIMVSYPRLPQNTNTIQQKVKKPIANKNFETKYTDEALFNILLEMKKVLKSSIFNEEKNSTNNFIQQNIQINPINANKATNKAFSPNPTDSTNITAEKFIPEITNGKAIHCENTNSNSIIKVPEREDLKRKHGKAFPNSIIGFEAKKFKKQPTIGDYFKKN